MDTSQFRAMQDIFRMLKAGGMIRERCLLKVNEKICKAEFRSEHIQDPGDRTGIEADANSVEGESSSAYFEINGEDSVHGDSPSKLASM